MKLPPHRLRFMSPAELRLYEEGELLYAALGEFFLLWADVETELYKTLIHFAGVTDDVGRAIFSGCRARTMIDFIKNIAHNTGMDDTRRNDFDYLSAQVNTINTIRDRIAHYGSASNISISHKTLKRSLSNRHRVGKKGHQFDDEISSATVNDMSADLRRITYRLSRHTEKDSSELGIDLPRDAPTWLYKPAPPKSPKNKNHAIPQSLMHRKKSSP